MKTLDFPGIEALLIDKLEFIKLLAEQTAANNSLMDTILGVTE